MRRDGVVGLGLGAGHARLEDLVLQSARQRGTPCFVAFFFMNSAAFTLLALATSAIRLAKSRSCRASGPRSLRLPGDRLLVEFGGAPTTASAKPRASAAVSIGAFWALKSAVIRLPMRRPAA